jgi:hypothetical protein
MFYQKQVTGFNFPFEKNELKQKSTIIFYLQSQFV